MGIPKRLQFIIDQNQLYEMFKIIHRILVAVSLDCSISQVAKSIKVVDRKSLELIIENQLSKCTNFERFLDDVRSECCWRH